MRTIVHHYNSIFCDNANFDTNGDNNYAGKNAQNGRKYSIPAEQLHDESWIENANHDCDRQGEDNAERIHTENYRT